MAKMRTKEIIPEKTPQKRGTDSYSYEKACNAAKNSGTPTYRFAVGDRVQISTPIISAVLFGMRRTERNCWTASSQDAKLVVSSSSSCPLIVQTTMATTTKSSMVSSVC